MPFRPSTCPTQQSLRPGRHTPAIEKEISASSPDCRRSYREARTIPFLPATSGPQPHSRNSDLFSPTKFSCALALHGGYLLEGVEKAVIGSFGDTGNCPRAANGNDGGRDKGASRHQCKGVESTIISYLLPNFGFTNATLQTRGKDRH